MFKRISFIKNFGVFRNFRRTGNIQDFKKLNIIYGWNYSGKTTISRLFQCLEKDEIHQDYPTCEFEIVDQAGNKYTEANLGVTGKHVRVFNTDFIRKNLKWDGETFEPILLLGEESIEAEQEIEKKQQKIERLGRIIGTLQSIQSGLNSDIENGLTNTARDITNKLRLVESFTKAHLRPLFREIRDNHSKYVLDASEEINLIRAATASGDDKLSKLPEYKPNLTFRLLVNEVKELVKVVPEFSKTIQYFIDHPDIAQWVEIGIPLHENKDVCEYCGNTISPQRTDDLLAHFSEDLKNHKGKLVSLKERISASKLNQTQNNQKEFYKQLQNDFEIHNQNINDAIQEYNNQLDELEQIVRTKIDEPFVQISELGLVNDTCEIISESISSFNEIIKRNNKITDEFDETKATAKAKLKKHYAALFIDEIGIHKKERKINIYRERESKLVRLREIEASRIQQLETQISNAQKGSEKLNGYIHSFLGGDEIKVEVSKEGENERFTLKRGNDDAVNLSEGEKTAIAFSFFLTKLMEVENLSSTIIYIDDPISSLDSNHIFQVNALLKEFFFTRGDENKGWEISCDQLFFSTHNFDFFSLLRELPKKGKPQNENELQHAYYFVKRKDKDEAIIEMLPDAIQKYTSEYQYLFKEIYDFYTSEDKSNYSVLMNLPNAVRRFVELYTYSRIPGNRNSTVDERANILWGYERAKRIIKVFHYFSHSNNIEKMSKFSDLLCEVEHSINDLISELKKDELHYDELIKSVN